MTSPNELFGRRSSTALAPPMTLLAPMALVASLASSCSPGETEVDPSWREVELGAPVTPRVMLIGLDGADFRNLRPLAEAGRVPHLDGLMQQGVTSLLETVDPASPIVWTSVATGVVPARHGIEFFRDELRRPAGTTHRRAPTFWNVLSACGRSVGVVSWWATFPAEDVDGYLISPYVVLMPPSGETARVHDLGAKDETLRKAYPPTLQAEIEPFLKRSEDMDLDEYPGLYVDTKRTTNTPWVLAKDTSYHAIALHMLEHHPVETVAFYFQGIDAVSHDWDRYVMGKPTNKVRDPIVSPEEVAAADARIETMYELTDGLVGELLAHATPETDVIVLSDHGWNYDGTSHWNELPGVFIASGPSFRDDFDGEISVLDITPIVLAIIGVPVSRELDGSIPDGLLTDEAMARVRYVDRWGLPPHTLPPDLEAQADELDAAMIERLKSLGYIGEDGREITERRPSSGG